MNGKTYFEIIMLGESKRMKWIETVTTKWKDFEDVITIMTGVKSPYVLGKGFEEQSLPVSKEMSDLGIEVLS